MDTLFEYATTVKLHDTDAAGVLFFANQFKLVHDAYETFLKYRGLGLERILEAESFALPIVHAETGFQLPLKAGDAFVVRLLLGETGSSSFTLYHEIILPGKRLAGSGKTVHVSIDKATGKKVPLPPVVREVLVPPGTAPRPSNSPGV